MTGVDQRGLAAFLGLAFGGAWLADLGLVLTGGVAGSSGWLLYVAMAAPAVATFVVSRYVSPTAHMRHDTGLILGRRGSGWAWYWLFGWLGMAALAGMAPFVGALLGVQSLDLATFSGAPSVFGTLLPGVPLGTDNGRTLVWIIIATLPLQALAAVPVVWLEEWGWRGYLLPSLLPLGTWRALLATGAVWGLWHVPAVLAGLNYPGQPLLGSIAIVLGSIVWGVLLGWTRLASGSVWPAVLGHAALNTAAVVPLLLAPADAPPNPLLVGVSGLTGWVLPVAVILLLISLGQLPRPGGLKVLPAEKA